MKQLNRAERHRLLVHEFFRYVDKGLSIKAISRAIHSANKGLLVSPTSIESTLQQIAKACRAGFSAQEIIEQYNQRAVPTAVKERSGAELKFFEAQKGMAIAVKELKEERAALELRITMINKLILQYDRSSNRNADYRAGRDSGGSGSPDSSSDSRSSSAVSQLGMETSSDKWPPSGIDSK